MVFSLPISGGTPTVLGSFLGPNNQFFVNSNGESPSGSLTLDGANLYGTTNLGGAYGYGVLFSLPISGGTPTVLASFDSPNSHGDLAISGSTIYEMTYGLSASGSLNLVSLPVSGGSFTTLHSFGGNITSDLLSGLLLSGSTLYGTTGEGGPAGLGTVFSINTDGSGYKDLFDFNGTNGAVPVGTLILSDSTLYGCTLEGGLDYLSGREYGTIFSLPVTGGNLTTLFSFTGPPRSSTGPFPYGAYPLGSLALSDSTLYGVTDEGGAYNNGTVFALNLNPTPEPSTFTLLVAAAGFVGYVWRRARRRSMKPGLSTKRKRTLRPS